MKTHFFPFLLLAISLQAFVTELAGQEEEHARKMAEGLKLFKSEIKPVLVGRCLKCHGESDIEGELDLSNRKSLMAGGQSGPAVLIGKARKSLLYKMIAHEVEPVMPEDGAKLDQRNINAIVKWIDLGVPYDGPLAKKSTDPSAWTREEIDPSLKSFWAFQPLKATSLAESQNDSWSQTEVDRFVFAKLLAKGMKPNPIIDRRRLVRRMYLSVTGLPPSPEQVESFVNDQRSDAVELLIEQLLGSDHFGEKWARHWLDVVRFAESHGFEQDYDRPHAYHYRDFVIKALNADMPFDQFVRWQIAGDELSPGDPLALMATGFLGAGVFPTQLTEKEFEPARYDELDDIASTIGTSMLGITIGCARCHDHKFDPIPQRDYYQFISTFTTTIRSEVELELNPDAIKEKLKQWNSKHRELRAKQTRYEEDKLKSAFEEWLVSEPEALQKTPEWVVLDFTTAKSQGGAVFQTLPDGSLLATGKNPDFDSYEFVATTNLNSLSALRIEALADPSLVRNGPGRASNGNFALGDLAVSVRSVDGAKAVPLKLVRPRATFEQNKSNLSIASSLDSNRKTGWAVDPQFGKNHAAIFDFEKPVSLEGEIELTIKMRFDVNNKHSIGRSRISITNSSTPLGFESDETHQSVVEIFEILKSRGKLTDLQRKSLFKWFRKSDPGWRMIDQEIQNHAMSKPKPEKTRVMISSEGLKPLKHNADGRNFPHFYKQTHFLNRGDTQQKQGVAKPGLIQVFSRNKSFSDYRNNEQEDGRLSYRRTALVNWLTDTKNGPGHQLARVAVNRIWQQYFGKGIVATPNDFGFQGARPTHPELLDWLAQKLIDEKWSLKSIHRLILKSAVYQQSSAFDPADSAKDHDNQFLWRYSPRRLDAEVIRDSMLAISDSLDQTMFGPGSLDERMKRRSIYFTIKRSRLIPMMQIFDSPEPLVSVGSRPRTTIAPQALLLMNNPNVRSYARNFAKKLIKQIDSKNGDVPFAPMVESGFQHALGRIASESEIKKNVAFLKRQYDSYMKEGNTTALELATTDFCQVLFCLNEFVYID